MEIDNFITKPVLAEVIPPISTPILIRPNFSVSEEEFYLQVKTVGEFMVRQGQEILYRPEPEVDDQSLELFLNGSVLGAVLHQRGIIPFHGSSFLVEGAGVMICGQSGAGKSSVTMAFCQEGALLINDDISPVHFKQSVPHFLSLKTKIKLWDNSLDELGLQPDGLDAIRPNLGKFYVDNVSKVEEEPPISQIVILSIHNRPDFLVKELQGLGKHQALLNQVYRKNYLKGMPKREQQYFKEVLTLARAVRVIQMTRPQKAAIRETARKIREVLFT